MLNPPGGGCCTRLGGGIDGGRRRSWDAQPPRHDLRSRKAIRHDQSLVGAAARPGITLARGPLDRRGARPSERFIARSRNAPGRDRGGAAGSSQRRAAPPPRRRILPRLVALLLLAPLMMGGLAGGAWYVFVRQGEEETYLELQGNIDVRQVNLSFKVDGRIETLAVDEGDTVKAGQVVATLDKRYFEDELRVARALRDNLAATLAKLEHGSRPE